jgi:hypothetical protein
MPTISGRNPNRYLYRDPNHLTDDYTAFAGDDYSSPYIHEHGDEGVPHVTLATTHNVVGDQRPLYGEVALIIRVMERRVEQPQFRAHRTMPVSNLSILESYLGGISVGLFLTTIPQSYRS